MNTQELSFLIQAPDNVGRNIVHVADWLAGGPDRQRSTRGAELLQQRIDEVAHHGKPIRVPEAGVHLTRWRNAFILQLDTEYRDSAGRILPVLCYGLVPDRASPEYSSYLTASLQEFMADHRFAAGDRLLRSAAIATTFVLEDAASSRAASLLTPVRKVGSFWRSAGHADDRDAPEDGATSHRTNPTSEAVTTVTSPRAPSASLPVRSSVEDEPPQSVAADDLPRDTARSPARTDSPRTEEPSGHLSPEAQIRLRLTDEEAQALLILLDWAEQNASDRTLLAPIADRLRSQSPRAGNTTIAADPLPTLGHL